MAQQHLQDGASTAPSQAGPTPGPTTRSTTAAHDGQSNGHSVETPDWQMWEHLMVDDDTEAWRARSRIVLQPMAAPSIMGLAGFMMATVMVGAWQAGWYGGVNTPGVLWPLALVAGGVLQSVAAVASFRARDGAAVAVHTAWGSFWVAWGIMQLLVATGVSTPILLGQSSPAFSFWFIGLTMITATGLLATIGRNLGMAATLAALTGGAGITAAGFWAGSLTTLEVGGWFFVVSAALAWLVVTALVLEHAYGRTIIPLGTMSKQDVPGRKKTVPIAYDAGMPGSRVGQ